MIYYTLSEDRDSIWLSSFNEEDSIEFRMENTEPAIWNTMSELINEYQKHLFGSKLNKTKVISLAKNIVTGIIPFLKSDCKIKFSADDRPSFEAVVKDGIVTFNMLE